MVSKISLSLSHLATVTTTSCRDYLLIMVALCEKRASTRLFRVRLNTRINTWVSVFVGIGIFGHVLACDSLWICCLAGIGQTPGESRRPCLKKARSGACGQQPGDLHERTSESFSSFVFACVCVYGKRSIRGFHVLFFLKKRCLVW